MDASILCCSVSQLSSHALRLKCKLTTACQASHELVPAVLTDVLSYTHAPQALYAILTDSFWNVADAASAQLTSLSQAFHQLASAMADALPMSSGQRCQGEPSPRTGGLWSINTPVPVLLSGMTQGWALHCFPVSLGDAIAVTYNGADSIIFYWQILS